MEQYRESSVLGMGRPQNERMRWMGIVATMKNERTAKRVGTRRISGKRKKE